MYRFVGIADTVVKKIHARTNPILMGMLGRSAGGRNVQFKTSVCNAEKPSAKL